MTDTTHPDRLTYLVPGVSCEHCRSAITAEVSKLAGVSTVDVDLKTRRVSVAGVGLDDGAVRAALDEAGYEIADQAAGPRRSQA